MPRTPRVAVKVDWAHFWWKVAYLIVNWTLPKQMQNVARIEPDARFQAFVGKHVQALVEKGQKPPPEIAAPIINLGEDYAAGRDLTVRAGDYIALQEFFRKNVRATE
jgi:hypothetical protein